VLVQNDKNVLFLHYSFVVFFKSDFLKSISKQAFRNIY